MSHFTQHNHGTNSQGTQYIRKGQEAQFTQHGGGRRVVIDDDEADVQVVLPDQIGRQSSQKSTFVQHNYDGVCFQAHEMTFK